MINTSTFLVNGLPDPIQVEGDGFRLLNRMTGKFDVRPVPGCLASSVPSKYVRRYKQDPALSQDGRPLAIWSDVARRLIPLTGSRPLAVLSDPYHTIISMSWQNLTITIAVIYFVTNLGFAFLYVLPCWLGYPSQTEDFLMEPLSSPAPPPLAAQPITPASPPTLHLTPRSMSPLHIPLGTNSDAILKPSSPAPFTPPSTVGAGASSVNRSLYPETLPPPSSLTPPSPQQTLTTAPALNETLEGTTPRAAMATGMPSVPSPPHQRNYPSPNGVRVVHAFPPPHRSPTVPRPFPRGPSNAQPPPPPSASTLTTTTASPPRSAPVPAVAPALVSDPLPPTSRDPSFPPFTCNARRAFYFGVQTWATIGYGTWHPITLWGNVVSVVQNYFYLVYMCFWSITLYHKMCRPSRARHWAAFSTVAVINEECDYFVYNHDFRPPDDGSVDPYGLRTTYTVERGCYVTPTDPQQRALLPPGVRPMSLSFRFVNRWDRQQNEMQITVLLYRARPCGRGGGGGGTVIVPEFTELETYSTKQVGRQRGAGSSNPVGGLPITVVHNINADSPLHGASLERLRRERAEIVVVVDSTDESVSDTVAARWSYTLDEVLVNYRFLPMLTAPPGQPFVVSLPRLSLVEPAPPPPPPRALQRPTGIRAGEPHVEVLADHGDGLLVGGATGAASAEGRREDPRSGACARDVDVVVGDGDAEPRYRKVKSMSPSLLADMRAMLRMPRGSPSDPRDYEATAVPGRRSSGEEPARDAVLSSSLGQVSTGGGMDRKSSGSWGAGGSRGRGSFGIQQGSSFSRPLSLAHGTGTLAEVSAHAAIGGMNAHLDTRSFAASTTRFKGQGRGQFGGSYSRTRGDDTLAGVGSWAGPQRRPGGSFGMPQSGVGGVAGAAHAWRSFGDAHPAHHRRANPQASRSSPRAADGSGDGKAGGVRQASAWTPVGPPPGPVELAAVDPPTGAIDAFVGACGDLHVAGMCPAGASADSAAVGSMLGGCAGRSSSGRRTGGSMRATSATGGDGFGSMSGGGGLTASSTARGSMHSAGSARDSMVRPPSRRPSSPRISAPSTDPTRGAW